METGERGWDSYSGQMPAEGWCGVLGFVPVTQDDGFVVQHLGRVPHEWREQAEGARVCRRCRAHRAAAAPALTGAGEGEGT